MICICSQEVVAAGYAAGKILSELAEKLMGKEAANPTLRWEVPPAGQSMEQALESISIS